MFDFIHIGQGKCLSTHLQHLWQKNDKTGFYYGRDLGNALNTAFFTKKRLNLNLSLKPNPNATHNLLSYECFTYYGVSSADELPYSDQFHNRTTFIASHLKGYSDKVLLIVRNPIDWIISSHAQYVKYGGTYSKQKYFENFRLALLSNLNLNLLIDTWESFGFRPVILPYELYAAKRNTFWLEYESKLNVERPNETELDDIQSNITRSATVDLRARLNSILHLINATLKADKNSHLIDKGLPEAADYYVKWAGRRFFELATDSEIIELNKRITENAEETDTLALEQSDFDFITNNFIYPLKAFATFSEFIPDYQCGLSKFTRI